MHLSRRAFLTGASSLVAGAGLSHRHALAQPAGDQTRYAEIYAPIDDDLYPVPAAPLSRIRAAFLRRLVPYETGEPAGTVVIDPAARYLYHVREMGLAMRYGVGVGRAGFTWSGEAVIHDKQEWPDWYPPKEMFGRQPELMEQMGDLPGGPGMPGGPGNPLGARAMYLWQGNKDTLYRIHGTFEPWTIGTNVSSGCIRMINQDVMNLYETTPVGTRVVVLSAAARKGRRHTAASLE